MSLFSRKDRSAEVRAFEYLNGKRVTLKMVDGTQRKGFLNDQDELTIVLTIPDNMAGDRKGVYYRQNILFIEEANI